MPLTPEQRALLTENERDILKALEEGRAYFDKVDEAERRVRIIESLAEACEKIAALEKLLKMPSGEFDNEKALGMLLLDGTISLYDDTEYTNGEIKLWINCNDVFAWACADAEDVHYDDIESIYKSWLADKKCGGIKWAIRKRGMPPQEPMVDLFKENGCWDEEMESIRQKFRAEHPDQYDDQEEGCENVD